jgi:DNA invertase Pin-like site-specific DNA recombinase
MERPALKRLLAAIEAGTVDTVVVYKVDRLTRALSDFARMVEIFDSHGISFVSVTQHFNTTTSMGRLTLNVLLSFAQFEREVTGERIRDKIAASKKKGMWMGGLPPLGFDVRDRALVVNEREAETARTLFRLYLQFRTVKALLAEANRLGLVTKRRRPSGRETGGRPFSRGHLYQLLRNPLYVGEVSHKGVRYPGQHKAIIDRETFDSVQRLLEENASDRRSATNAKAPSLLTGLVFDETGDRLCPTHASKKGRRYRYYISKRLMHRSSDAVDGWRLPARELENAVLTALVRFLRDEGRMLDALRLDGATPDRLRTVFRRSAELAAKLKEPHLLERILHRVALRPDAICIAISRSKLRSLIVGTGQDRSEHPDEPFELTVPVMLKRRGVEAKLIVQPGGAELSRPDGNLIALLAQAHGWAGELAQGRIGSINEIAERESVHASDVGRILQLAFLAPDIVQAILAGRQPVELTAKQLKRFGPLPYAWADQRRVLEFAA